MAVASGGAKNVAQQAVRVHADQDRLGRIADIATSDVSASDVTADQGHVGFAAVHFALIGDQAEFSVLGFDHRLAHTMHVALMLHAVADQLRHGEHFHFMRAAELNQVRHAGHGAVVFHDFADDPRRDHAGQSRQIDGSFGLSARTSTPPLRARSGKTCPGRARSDGRDAGSIAVLMVCERSYAEIPVVTPSRASIASQKAVPYCDVFSLVMGPMRKWSSRSSVMARQTRPRPCLAMKLIASGVTFSAARVRSPSFSRSSSSITTIIRPARTSSMAVGTSVKGELGVMGGCSLRG